MAYPGEALIIKMWESLVDIGMGGVLRPLQIRREGKAAIDLRVEEKLRLAQAEHQAQALMRGEATLNGGKFVMLPRDGAVELMPPSNSPIALDASVTHRITSAATAEAIRKEVNVAKAILEAEAELENDASAPPEDSVNDDWLYRWRDYASEVSSEELQSMWGKILAGETKRPGSFSLRTMEFLRNVSNSEAQEIIKLAPFVVQGMIYRKDDIIKPLGLSYGFLMRMQELGILSGVEAFGMTNEYDSQYPDKFLCVLMTTNKLLIIEHEDAAKKAKLPACKLTAVGKELIYLCKADAHEPYLREVGHYFLNEGFKVKLASVIKVVNELVEFNNEELLNSPQPPQS